MLLPAISALLIPDISSNALLTRMVTPLLSAI